MKGLNNTNGSPSIIGLMLESFVEQVVRDLFTELEIIKENYPDSDCPEWFRVLTLGLPRESNNLAKWVENIKQDIGLSRFCHLIEEGRGQPDSHLKALKSEIVRLAFEYISSDAKEKVQYCMDTYFFWSNHEEVGDVAPDEMKRMEAMGWAITDARQWR